MDFIRNISSNERSVRLIAGCVLLAWSIAGLGFLSSILGFIYAILGTYLVGTSIISHCLIYKKLGINSYVEQ